MFLTPLILPIFFDTPETELEDKIGLNEDTPLRGNREIRSLLFYSIDVIAPYKDRNDDDRIYSWITVGGESFICTYPPAELANKIAVHRRVERNMFN